MLGSRWAIKFNWKIGLFYIAFMPVLLWLGYWQLDRAEFKEQLQATYDARQNAEPLNMEELFAETDLAYQRVFLEGRFDNKRHFLLDNRTYQGRAGYEVITPFVLAKLVPWGNDVVEVVLVSRGWLALGASRETLPEIPKIEGLQRITAFVGIVGKESFVLADIPLKGQWPEVIQKVDLVAMEEQLGQPVYQHLLRLSQGAAGELQRAWKPINMSPEKHFGYAVQWFAMALTLTMLYLFVTIKRVKE